VTVEPGKTTTTALGAGGREVVVKIHFPDNISTGQHTLNATVTDSHGMPEYPPMPLYAMEFSDNIFHIEGVKPGDYQIQLSLQSLTNQPGGATQRKQEGHAMATFRMPTITSDLINKPLEIPDITVTPN
jgi:hypothetical protein